MSMTTKYTLNCSIDAERPGLSKPNHIDPKIALFSYKKVTSTKKYPQGTKYIVFRCKYKKIVVYICTRLLLHV